MRNRIRMGIRALLAASAILLLGACGFITPRALSKEKEHTIRVLVVEDEDAPMLTEEEYITLLTKHVPHLTYEHLGYRVRFRVSARRTAQEFFADNYGTFTSDAVCLRTFDVYKGNKRVLLNAIYEKLKTRSIDDIESFLPREARGKRLSLVKATEYIAERALSTIKRIYEWERPTGKPLYNKRWRTLYARSAWERIGTRLSDSDMVIVNIPIASLSLDMSIEELLHAGVTEDIVVRNLRAKGGHAVILSVYPYLSVDPLFVAERGVLPDFAKADVIAYAMLHNMGHMLAGYADHEGFGNCVMNPPEGFDYFGWYTALLERPPAKPFKRYARFQTRR